MSRHDSEVVLFFFTAFSICTSPVCFVSEVVGQLSPQQVPPVPPQLQAGGGFGGSFAKHICGSTDISGAEEYDNNTN